MGTPLARMTDKGTGRCCCHSHPTCRDKTGFIMEGSTNNIINGLPAARMNNKIVASCGHIGIIIGGSAKTMVNGLPAARLGDKFSGCFTGTIISSSSNVNG